VKPVTDSTVATTTRSYRSRTQGKREVALALRAISSSWVEVRETSSTGRMLYVGLLPPGARKSFRAAQRLWVRFGGAASLAVTLNGRPLRVPSGTYDALFDANGIRQTTIG